MHQQQSGLVRAPGLTLRTISLFAWSGLVWACSGEVVNMGEDADPPPPYSRCLQSSTLTGDVRVEDQQQLNELDGCQAIEGGLNIVPFAGADLAPLHALRSVGGLLSLSEPEPAEGWVARTWDVYSYNDPPMGQEFAALYENGWVESLQGLEALERVGGLRIAGLAAETIEPLAKLESLANGGYLSLTHCPNLRDLQGLRSVSGVLDLQIDCDALESLDGLSLPPQINSVHLKGPHLADLGSFGVRGVVTNLFILGTALDTLDGLSALQWVGGDLTLADNGALTNMNGLNALQNAGSLTIASSGLLERLPAFEALEQLQSLTVAGNAALRDTSAFYDAHSWHQIESSVFARDQTQATRPIWIEVSGNPELESFAMPMQWHHSYMVAIGANAKLREIDLGWFRKIEWLMIHDNPALERIVHNQLDSVDLLDVQYNPLLPANTFEDIRAFDIAR
jgi:hypothetical protein